MEIGNDIFEKIGKPSMGVPEGYFDSLKSRLESIPSAKVLLPWSIWAIMQKLRICFIIAKIIKLSYI